MRNKKLQVWLPLIFSVVMIAGMFFGFKLHQETGSTTGFFKKDRTTSLQEALDLIKDRYVDNIGIDSLQDDAINEVMNHLDPHSVYIPSNDVSTANEDLIGNFEGVGIEFNIFEDTVHILYVMPSGPSDIAGLRIGDKIIKVNDVSIVSKTLPSQEIRKMMRGKGGTKVKLTVLRDHTILYKEVVRGTIPLPSLDAAYMMDVATGYIKLNKFSETTYREFMESLEVLQKQGMKNLVLDLRDNGGGFIKQAVDIADEFLNNDKLIVYTQGANVRREDYKAKRPGLFEEGKLIIIVDESTASASEILAGAVQDWDRGTIIGRRTFGKGLVQNQFEMTDGSVIRLTIARYYTPVGRSIQRPYDKGKREYNQEIYQRWTNGEMVNADSFQTSGLKVYKTLLEKRTVFGGGGIVPDVFVPIDTSVFTRSVTRLYLEGRFNNFVYKYFIDHQDLFNQYKSAEDFANRYQNSADVWNQLVVYALNDSIYLKNIPERDKASIQEKIKAYLAKLKWRNQGYFQVYNNYDPAVKKAKELLSTGAAAQR
ncbi:MAG: S41 family peptidase [Flavisolibacter sp.]